MSEGGDTSLTQVKPAEKNIPEKEQIPEERSVGSITEAIERIKEKDPERASRTFFFNPGHTNYLTGIQKSEKLNYEIDYHWRDTDFWSVNGKRFLFIDYEDLLADSNFQKNNEDQSKFLDVLRMELSTASVATALKLMQGQLSKSKQESISPDEKKRLEESVKTIGNAAKEALFRANHLAEAYSGFLKASEEHSPSVPIENDTTEAIHNRINEEITSSFVKEENGKWQLNKAYQHVLEPQT